MKYKNRKKIKRYFVYTSSILHLYFILYLYFLIYTTSNIYTFEFAQKYINLESLPQVYFKVSK